MSARPRVLLVGPYERDNVGDLLFLLVTERYLGDADVVAAAPFAADMTALLDRRVPAYPELLKHERFDAVWTVGGQVGSIDTGKAYRISAPPDEHRRFTRATRWRRRALLARHGLGVAPYIPSLDVGDAFRVVNSAGVSGIRHVPSPRREELLDLLRAQDRIAIRDQASSDYLAEHGIAHALEPDAVHALGVVHPLERDPRSDTAIIQISNSILADLGHEWVAAQLAHSAHLRDLKLRFLLAGTARGHDSIAAAEDVAQRVVRLRPHADVAVRTERRPLTIVEQIARARVVLSTSLHVRIIASAYDVPRASLARPKATRYAATWDPGMPYGVTLDRLDAALAAALSQPASAAHLSRRTHEHLTALAAEVTGAARPEPERALLATV